MSDASGTSGGRAERGGSGGRSAPGRGTERRQKTFLDPPEEAQPFFDAAREHRLVIQRCSACGKYQFYPRKMCVHCGSVDLEWIEASGRGTVHTFTVVHRGIPGWVEDGPYVAAVIDLDEGVRMTSNIVDCPPSDVTVDMPVEVTFVLEGQDFLPRFRPAP
jgi:hypothetical protein